MRASQVTLKWASWEGRSNRYRGVERFGRPGSARDRFKIGGGGPDRLSTRNETKIPANPATISVARRVIMSINVFNHSDAVKTKVVILAGFVLAAVLSSVEAGPRVGAHVRAGGAWCPAKPACPPVQKWCGPIIYRPWPVSYYPPSYCFWGQSPAVSSTSFANISPAYESGELGIYRVPAPVFPAPAIVESPGSTFRWRR
jgi:hypothetical protein